MQALRTVVNSQKSYWQPIPPSKVKPLRIIFQNMPRDVVSMPHALAHGVPLGGELEYIDGGTLAHAFAGRTII